MAYLFSEEFFCFLLVFFVLFLAFFLLTFAFAEAALGLSFTVAADAAGVAACAG